MFKIALRKMIKNKGLTICLLLGCLLSVALFSSMPAYSRGVLQRMILKEFEARQIKENTNPLRYQLRMTIGAKDATAENDLAKEEQVHAMFSQLGMEAMQEQVYYTISSVNYQHVALEGEASSSKSQRSALSAATGFENHVEIIAGRMASQSMMDGEYEVIVSESALRSRDMMLGSRYQTASMKTNDEEPYYFRVVGVFRQKDLSDPYWFSGVDTTGFRIPVAAFMDLIGEAKKDVSFQKAWFFPLDYASLQVENVDGVYEAVTTQQGEKTGFVVYLSNIRVFEDYFQKREEIGLFLWVLMVPIAALLAFYIVMISSLVFDHDRNEIALIKSRGAGRLQVFMLYVWQSLLISAVAFAGGIPLGMGLCNVLGSANGFLQFVGRSPLQLLLTPQVILYGLGGALLFILAMLLPVLFAREGSIVTQKRRRAAKGNRPFYERAFLDVILLAVSLLGLSFYNDIAGVLTAAGMKSSEVPVNPLLFLLSTLFIFGCGLLFSRLFPYVIRLIYRLGQNAWPPTLYASLIGASRARSRSRFLMIFLVITVSLGIFSSISARTINGNREDRISYMVGADIRLQESWLGVDPSPEYDASGMPVEKEPYELLYTEPPFEKYAALDGVAQTTRVYRNQRATMRAGGRTMLGVNVIAIEPESFAQTVWTRSDLYDYHINHMMNALLANPNVVLLSSATVEELGIGHGDKVEITWKNNKAYLSCVVYDGVDFFPTFDPTPEGSGEKRSYPALVVMNFDLVQSRFLLEPYEVWMDLSDGVSSADVLLQMQENKIRLESFEDVASQTAQLHADPLLQGMNGTLTLSFIITIIITTTGFMIFWVIDLKSRQLQMGIIRSLGMTGTGVMLMLVWEQLLLSVVPMLAGLGIGALASKVFVPMFEFGMVASQAVPAFAVMALPQDFYRVLVILGITILLAMGVLGAMISRMKISQTLKLGED